MRSSPVAVFVPFADGKAQNVFNGFLDGDKSRGRPVAVALDRPGALLIADDVRNTVWRVSRQ